MSRPLRILYEGAWYHVMNRGAAKKAIFLSDLERKLFLEILEDTHNRYKIEVHAYCLMANHYHLLVHTPLPNLSQAIKYLNGIYVRKFNAIHKKDGPLFRSRFKSILVERDEYLTYLTRYIHLNPVEASMCEKPWNYEWSSCRAYLGQARQPKFLYCENVLSYFNSTDCHAAYKNFLESESEIVFEDKFPVVGSEDFVDLIKNKYFKDHEVNADIPESKQLAKRILPSFDDVMETISQYYKVNKNDLINRKAKFHAQEILIYLVVLICHMKLKEVTARISNITETNVSRIYNKVFRKIKRDLKLKAEIDGVVKAIMLKCGTKVLKIEM